MKKTILAALILAACATAQAEWKHVAENDENVVYIDRATIRRDAPVVRFWTLTDYKGTTKYFDGKPHKSTRIRMLINCADETYRRDYIGFMTDRMGEGTVADETKGLMTTIPFKAIPPETGLWFLMEAACPSRGSNL